MAARSGQGRSERRARRRDAVPRQFGNVVGGFYLAKGAIAASLALGEAGADAAWLEGKIAIADFFAEGISRKRRASRRRSLPARKLSSASIPPN
ncbi:MAG: acyl-CoA dehydrogenase C-terminal domain-containing protein [Parvularculaceae bacterium]